MATTTPSRSSHRLGTKNAGEENCPAKILLAGSQHASEFPRAAEVSAQLRRLSSLGQQQQNGGQGAKYKFLKARRGLTLSLADFTDGEAMDASACMKSLLLAASQYRAARTQPNAALLQRSLEVRDSLGRPPGFPPRPRLSDILY